MPNHFAYLAILTWPMVALLLFRWLPVPKAAMASIIWGYLLLPGRTSFNLPLLPAYDQSFAANVPALIMAVLLTRSQMPGRRASSQNQITILPGWLPREPLVKLCLLVLLIGPFITALLNPNPVVVGSKLLRGLGPYDAASSALSAAMALIPFFFARKFLAHPREHATLLGLLCLAGLTYSLPTLFEIRMSPQLNRMIYGFSPSWQMSLRGDGFRPSVFLGHGLRLGIFMTVAVLATLGFSRTRPAASRWRLLIAALWLLGTLALSKTLGALIIVAGLAPVILLAKPRLQILVAASIVTLVLLFPMSRSTGVFPVDTVMQAVSMVASPDRQRSLNFRFKNEDILLARANKRPFFGWGGWGRARVYDEDGRSASVTDGLWIIIFGEGGWLRYLSMFGLLTLPVILLALRRRRLELTVATTALALALAANLVDLIPNSGMSAVVWLMAGAVAGRLELGRITVAESASEDIAEVQASRYRRNHPRHARDRFAPRQRGRSSLF